MTEQLYRKASDPPLVIAPGFEESDYYYTDATGRMWRIEPRYPTHDMPSDTRIAIKYGWLTDEQIKKMGDKLSSAVKKMMHA